MEYSKEEYANVGSILQDGNKQYELIDIVGRGSCGAVYLAQCTSSPYTCYAVKTLPKNKLKPQMCEEISIHRLVGWHPSIVSLEFVIETEETVYIGLEYCEGGDLYDAITVGNITNCADEFLSESRDSLVKKVFMDILQAVDICHSHGIYHRDLKPENILLNGQGQIKLADFGLATRNLWSKEFGCGSCFYMSPEAHKSRASPGSKLNPMPYSTAAADIWSLGVVFLNLCFGRNPWKRANSDDAAFLEYIFNPNLLADMFPLSPEGHHIVTRMLCINPNRRITLSELIEEISNATSFIRSKHALVPLDQQLVQTDVCDNSLAIEPMDSGLGERTALGDLFCDSPPQTSIIPKKILAPQQVSTHRRVKLSSPESSFEKLRQLDLTNAINRLDINTRPEKKPRSKSTRSKKINDTNDVSKPKLKSNPKSKIPARPDQLELVPSDTSINNIWACRDSAELTPSLPLSPSMLFNIAMS